MKKIALKVKRNHGKISLVRKEHRGHWARQLGGEDTGRVIYWKEKKKKR